ncbi:MAG: diguanylate cyclase [Dokdonella sp.]|nr:diguanylate cyclase [Dokdonella sp.]
MSERRGGENGHASDTIAKLNAQVEAVRAELSRLRGELAVLRAEEHMSRPAVLKAANERLVVAALHASAEAEAARKSLAELVVTGQRDVLTNTPNRALALERLDNAIGMAKRHDAMVAVLFVDLDQLKSINDSLGHAYGDAALQLVARRLESVVRDTDTVSRHGGDEFVVLLSEVSRLSDAGDVAGKMLQVLSAPAEIQGHMLSLTASIGIAVFPLDASTGSRLIDAADSAMYVVKRRGGSGYGFHDPVRMAAQVTAPDSVTGRPVQAEWSGGAADLRQVNEQLMVSALAAQALGDLADEGRNKQIKCMATIAHELRHQLTPIKLAADLLISEGVDDARLRQLQAVIENELGQLARLVDDLLDRAGGGAGKRDPDLCDVDLAAVLKLTIDAGMPRIMERGQHVKAGLPSEPVVVRGDTVCLARVFSALLENASQSTHTGGHIEVSAAVAVDEVAVSICDDGIGIRADALEHVFDRFVPQIGASALHGRRLGVGLAVVHELVTAHRGTVSAASGGTGQGSRFTVTLPLAGPE